MRTETERNIVHYWQAGYGWREISPTLPQYSSEIQSEAEAIIEDCMNSTISSAISARDSQPQNTGLVWFAHRRRYC